ncbi:isocitrate lyase/PEP mutase family protein [Pseudonocardia sp. TRM90224]|uniref:isocitrate lyase/PEP mutase family protein n=1 Tax=Pseudonocardia sp. TRM90224 TaxID=2812678 RepID=UPI001E4DC956|nr:isocitrate lyase/phosphoenolpyruvate mutase family protein [Pseudonocardia sp. TRM90224]
MTEDQIRRAEAFARLHAAADPLLLPNAWDVASALAVVDAGAAAVATTSAGVAWSLGVADGADLGAERAADAIRRITAAVDVPVSADIEAGYGPTPADVAATTAAVVQAGAVGVNIEDRSGVELFAPQVQAERLAAARSAAAGVPVWINARTDVYLAGIGEPGARLRDVQERAAAYKAAGADSIFVPGLIDLDTIRELVAGPLPIAVMVWPGAPTVAELAAAGVRRISLGSAIAEAAYGVAARATRELLTTGTYDSVAGGIGYGELNALLAPTRD